MKSISRSLYLVLLGTCLTGALTARAHYLWIEDTHEHGLTFRFAEWPDEYETSPGHLDDVDPPSAWKTGTNGQPVALTFKKESDQIRIVGASVKDAVQLEAGFQVMTPAMMRAEGAPVATNMPSRKPVFYARWQPAGAGAGVPSLNFDIVPTANVGEYRVYFRGEPLAKAKVTAHLPDGKESELVADDQGIVHFSGEKPGLYMLTCKHQRETIKGFSGGTAYDAISHNCSVTWRQGS